MITDRPVDMAGMKWVMLFGLLVSAAGCTRSSGPILAGGKPVQHWFDALRSPVAKVRKEAVAKLGNVGGADPAAFPAVLFALRDKDATVRREAILAVLKFGQRTDEAIAQLSELSTRDPDTRARTYARKALGKLRSRQVHE